MTFRVLIDLRVLITAVLSQRRRSETVFVRYNERHGAITSVFARNHNINGAFVNTLRVEGLQI